MCSPEEEALLQLEEVFSATLGRINSLVLKPLFPDGESQFSCEEGKGHRNCLSSGRSFTWWGPLTFSFLTLTWKGWHLVSASSHGTGVLAPRCYLLLSQRDSEGPGREPCPSPDLAVRRDEIPPLPGHWILWLNSHLALPQGMTGRGDAEVLLPVWVNLVK